MTRLRISFTIPGVPVAKGRARSGRNGVHYTPDKTRNYEAHVEQCGRAAMVDKQPIEVACLLNLRIYMPIPKSWSDDKKERAQADLIYPDKKPDTSNILKAIEDGLNEIVWSDDCQIVDHDIKRRYCAHPRVEVTVVPLL